MASLDLLPVDLPLEIDFHKPEWSLPHWFESHPKPVYLVLLSKHQNKLGNTKCSSYKNLKKLYFRVH